MKLLCLLLLATSVLCQDIINNDSQPIYGTSDFELESEGNNTTSHRKFCCSANQIVIITFVVLIGSMVLIGCIISKCPMCKKRAAVTGYEDII
jgi:hypothetical protein